MNIEYDRKQSIAAVESAVDLADGPSNLARLVNQHLPPKQHITQTHIYNWINRPAIAPMPPAEYVLPMVMVVNFEITPAEFRNDLYPPEHVQVAV